MYHECGVDLQKCTFYFKYDKANTLYLVYVAGLNAEQVFKDLNKEITE